MNKNVTHKIDNDILIIIDGEKTYKSPLKNPIYYVDLFKEDDTIKKLTYYAKYDS